MTLDGNGCLVLLLGCFILGERTCGPIAGGVCLGPEPVWTLWRRYESFAPAETPKMVFRMSSPSVVRTPTAISQLHVVQFQGVCIMRPLKCHYQLQTGTWPYKWLEIRLIKQPMGIFFGESYCWQDRILCDREINNTVEMEMKCLVIIICFQLTSCNVWLFFIHRQYNFKGLAYSYI